MSAAEVAEWKAKMLERCDSSERWARENDRDLATARVILIVRRKSKPRNWERMRILPGCYGRVVGETEKGSYQVDVLADDLRRALGRVQP